MEFLIIALLSIGLPIFLVSRGIKSRLKPKSNRPTGLARHVEQTDSDGELVEKTFLAKSGFGNLDVNAAVVANAGAKRQALQSLDEFILRPTMGVRTISLVCGAAVGYLIWFGNADFLPAGEMARPALTALVAYAIFHLNSYELRYNRDRLTTKGWAFNRREHKWRDLVRIRDNGHYLYVLNFSDGSKLEVQKFLVGMPDFLTLAKRHISANVRGECLNSQKSRPSEGAFSPQWKAPSLNGRM